MEREEEIGGRGVPWGDDAAAEVAGERGNAAARGGAREIGEREGEGRGGLGSKCDARGGTTTSDGVRSEWSWGGVAEKQGNGFARRESRLDPTLLRRGDGLERCCRWSCMWSTYVEATEPCRRTVCNHARSATRTRVRVRPGI